MDVSPELINSPHNARFKRWQSYVKSPEATECPWFPVEGPKQALELSRDYQLELLLYSRENSKVADLATRSVNIARLTPSLLSRLSSVRTHQGLVAFFSKPSWTWHDISTFVLYLEELQDPGNLGTLLRTAQATGLFSLITSPSSVSPWNPKVIRASSGALMRVPTLENISLKEMRKRKYQLIATSPRGSHDLFQQRFSPGTAFLIGNEGRGLTSRALRLAEKVYGIPMEKESNSLNTAVVGSLVMYQVYLQKQKL